MMDGYSIGSSDSAGSHRLGAKLVVAILAADKCKIREVN